MVYHPEVIYGRVLGLQSSSRSVNDVMAHELAPLATAIFDYPLEMKIAKAKSNLKNILRVDISSRTVNASSALDYHLAYKRNCR